MLGQYEIGLTSANVVREPIDFMGACSDRAYVTARLGEQGVAVALGSRSEICDHQVAPVTMQVEQPMLPIEQD
jgi:hypothetical protein